MPISYTRARELAQRLSRGQSFDVLTGRLRPVPVEEQPLGPRVPGQALWTAEARAERIAAIEQRGVDVPALAGRADEIDPAALKGNIENYIGMTCIPTGLIGPLRVNGLHAAGDYYVPLATSEGALIASYDRGARIISLAGGASALTTTEQVQRAPG
ncbi:MAG: 3-hydroxy-3-methylglutaryl-CoA reductase, partial [Gemmatimonadaceae bacterium]|nr:3-hydroxy-3-methylglutaryl-CoA reductase [Gemmatimonadaceae bacterium]